MASNQRYIILFDVRLDCQSTGCSCCSMMYKDSSMPFQRLVTVLPPCDTEVIETPESIRRYRIIVCRGLLVDVLEDSNVMVSEGRMLLSSRVILGNPFVELLCTIGILLDKG